MSTGPRPETPGQTQWPRFRPAQDPTDREWRLLEPLLSASAGRGWPVGGELHHRPQKSVGMVPKPRLTSPHLRCIAALADNAYSTGVGGGGLAAAVN